MMSDQTPSTTTPPPPDAPTDAGAPASGIRHARGHVRHPDKDAMIARSHLAHADHLRFRLRSFAPPMTWDSWKLGIIGPIRDQKQCGSCWNFSGTRTTCTAFWKAGLLKTSQNLSEQYTMDCYRTGGCNGDDNVTVLDHAKSVGLPLDSDYGTYSARSGSCKYKPSMTLYKLDDWLFADSNGGQGVTPVDDIKAQIMDKGGVGCAVAAGSSWDGYQAGTIHTGNSKNIDHDVFLSGWNDTGTVVRLYIGSGIRVTAATGWWWMDNSWGEGWGEGGRMRIAYGADSIGTEAVAAIVRAVNPPSVDYNW